MRVSFLCSDEQHPVNKYLFDWITRQQERHQIELVRRKSELSGGDILFLISCSEIVNADERSAYRVSLVLHASDLPHGRGWSPHIWQLIAGADEITLSLLEAEDKVDSGRIWKKVVFPVPKHALCHEINKCLFEAEIELIDFAIDAFENIVPAEQTTSLEPTYYPRRLPEDSRVDPLQSIASQFDKIRVCDPDRFPAFFELHGINYKITLEKIND
ncbi:UDP-glucuronic acid dehydrogenase [Stutzerimonas kirkiae]|uniref:UDP-glucuronic acid dehydrogenase n=1 Tax=Stutzerimonas kirkiae TaxID=2211392 RepID=UPI0010385190|nr:UDP-glucuronic acid dehydrogenase [Stutzerimonas kirkiae]TBV10796.1 UDP-glucuronic acid dehydrogenase [Stutzerimonas kirkiae]